MRDELKLIGICFFISYVSVSVLALTFGYSDSGYMDRGCAKKNRGQYLVPTYRLGCYLGEEIE